MKLKSSLIQVRVSQEEHEKAKQEAARDGLSVSEWVRLKIKNSAVENRIAVLESTVTNILERIAQETRKDGASGRKAVVQKGREDFF